MGQCEPKERGFKEYKVKGLKESTKKRSNEGCVSSQVYNTPDPNFLSVCLSAYPVFFLRSPVTPG
jgi:hypothetical protein